MSCSGAAIWVSRCGLYRDAPGEASVETSGSNIMLNRRHVFRAALALAPALAAGHAFAQQAIVGISTTTTYTAEGRIAAADPVARTVTLTMADGSSRTVNVSQGGRDPGQYQSGRYRPCRPRGKAHLRAAPVRTPRHRATAARPLTAVGTMGNSVGAVAADKSITNWWVTASRSGRQQDLAGRSGRRTDPHLLRQQCCGRTNLPRVKPGDSLTSISSDILAVSLTPKS